MNQKNDETSGMFMALALIGAMAAMVAAFVFALMAFASLVITVLCLFAWNSSISFFGQTLHPEEARRFVRNGVIGAVTVPSFIAFVSVLFNVEFIPAIWTYAVIGGYAGGSILVEMHLAEQQNAQSLAQPMLPPVSPAPPAQQIAPPPAAPFRFPAPPLMMSAPAPPSIKSLPSSPFSESLPARP